MWVIVCLSLYYSPKLRSDYNKLDHFEFLLQSDYRDLIGPALSSEKIDFSRLSVLTDNYLTTILQVAQTQAFGPLPLLAFLNAKDIEVTNLRLIIVGKRSGFTKEAIYERMRTLYDL